MIPRTLVISDPHLGNHADYADYAKGGLNSRLLLQIEAIRNAIVWGETQGCRRLMLLGDVFHKRGYVEPEVFNLFAELLGEMHLRGASRIKPGIVETIIVTGNHDITVEGPVFNTAAMLDGLGGNTHVRAVPCVTQDEAFMPFTKEGFEDKLDTLIAAFGAKKRDLVLWMHQTVRGTVYGSRTLNDGADPAYLRDFRYVLCGHVHEPQPLGKYGVVVGAPYPLNHGDTKERRVLAVDFDGTVKIKEYEPKHPRFRTVAHSTEIDNAYDFFRVTDGGRGGVPSNARLAYEPLVKKQVRTAAKTDGELVAAYCKREGKPEMAKPGMELIKRFEKTRPNT